MKKLIAIHIVLIAALLTTLGVTGVFANDNQIPSAKTSAVQDGINDVPAWNWETILETDIKTGTPKDLVIGVTAECALVTLNKITGKTNLEATLSAVKIEVQVLVDEVPVEIDGDDSVVFAGRAVILAGDLRHGYETDPNNYEHWLLIFIATKTANGFNFIAEDVGPNVSHIEVQARMRGIALDTPGSLAGYAGWIGNASVVVDEVHLK